ELERFQEAVEDMDLELPSASVRNKVETVARNFSVGDNVEVCEGELIYLRGKILSINGSIITVMPKHKDLNEAIEFQAHELKKHFKQGDHVKVIAGRYEGDTGLIVSVEDNRVVLFSDLTMHELEILPRDIQLCTHITSGIDSQGEFEWGDSVQIDSQTVVLKIKRQALEKRRNSAKAVALDCDQNAIQKKDIVKVIDGPHNGREGEIKFLYRNFAFVRSKLYLENGGIFVCRTKHLQLAGGAKVSQGRETSMFVRSPYRSQNTSKTYSKESLKRDKELIGQTVKITTGAFKAIVGIVKDATNSTVRVELHSNGQTISVDRSHIKCIGMPPKSGSGSDVPLPMYGSGSQTPVYRSGNKTPTYGSQTPMYDAGSRTPHFGSATPVHEGSRTPGQSGAWDPSITNTPARSSDQESSSSNYDCYQHGIQPINMIYPSGPFSSYQQSPLFNRFHVRQISKVNPGYIPSPDSITLYGTPSPVMYSPVTPPGTQQVDTSGPQDWFTTDIEVKIKATHDDPGLVGQIGVIRGISGYLASLFLPQEDRSVNVTMDHLEPVLPERLDSVKVILGEEKEAVGQLLSIDNGEGIMKLVSGEVKMLPLKYLSRMKSTRT
ncbi:hypothetical protein L9F63_023072, partial [Diploptera punctata]